MQKQRYICTNFHLGFAKQKYVGFFDKQKVFFFFFYQSEKCMKKVRGGGGEGGGPDI